jgi:hypothetical protein
VRRNIIRWLGTPALGSSARRWLHKLCGREEWAEALADGHLLLAPSRKRALRQADRPMQCLPARTDAQALPDRIQSGVPRLAGRLNLTGGTRRRLLAEMSGLPSPIARYRAEAVLAAQGGGSAERPSPYLFDAELAVARAAFASRPVPGHAILERIEREGHRRIARRAGAILARTSGERFFHRWRGLTRPHRCAAAMAVLDDDRDRFILQLRRILETGAEGDRLEAIMLARRLRIVPLVEEQLILLAGHDNARVASAALGALSDGRTADCSETLRAGLERTDGRVRANAIEALARATGREALPYLAPLANDAHNRVRGNAMRALLRLGDGAAPDRLCRMLADERPLHRVSAIWAARSARAVAIAPELERMAHSEWRVELRTRADAALRLLEQQRPNACTRKAVRAT